MSSNKYCATNAIYARTSTHTHTETQFDGANVNITGKPYLPGREIYCF